MTLEEQVKAVACQVANKRWGHPGGPNGMYGSLQITRIEQDDDGDWNAYYREPDTLTEEEILVEHVGNELRAYAWYGEEPIIWKIEEEGTPPAVVQ